MQADWTLPTDDFMAKISRSDRISTTKWVQNEKNVACQKYQEESCFVFSLFVNKTRFFLILYNLLLLTPSKCVCRNQSQPEHFLKSDVKDMTNAALKVVGCVAIACIKRSKQAIFPSQTSIASWWNGSSISLKNLN